jgi:hypothetical protein
MFKVPEKYRTELSNIEDGNNGYFLIHHIKLRVPIQVIASDGLDWEHVSVSLPHRCPTWDEMCFIKNLFWDEEDTVIQFHPANNNYVNNHKHCLHLWRPISQPIPLPPKILV